MNINQLRLKHRNNIIQHATRIFGVDVNAAMQHQAVQRFLSGGDLQDLFAAFRDQANRAIDPQHARVAMPVQEGTGSISVCVSNQTFCSREMREVRVEVKNLSSTTWKTDEQSPTFLSYHWYTEDGELCEFNGLRTPLSQAIHPGETKLLTVNVQSFNGIGNYLLEVTMVMEGKFWFEQCGLNTLLEPIKITPITPPKLSPYTNRIFKNLMAAIEKNKQEVV